jgi:hypothetical protein
MTRMLAYQNPDDLKAAMADGTILGNDARYARQSTLAGLPKEINDMYQNSLTQAQTRAQNATAGSTEQTTAWDKVLHERNASDYALSQNANPLVTSLVSKYTSQGPAGVAPAIAELEKDPSFMKMTPEMQATYRESLTNGLQAPTNVAKSFADTIEANAQTRAQEGANAIIRQLDQAKTQEEVYDGVQAIQDPRVKALVQAHYSPKYPTLFPDQYSKVEQSKGPTGAIGAMDLDEHAIYAPGKYQYNAPAGGWSNTTVEEASKIGDQMKDQNKNDVLAPDKNGKMVPTGSSAKTQYMMVNGTMEKAAQALTQDKNSPLYGQDWKQVKLTPQNQELLAQYTFNQIPHNTEALSKVWTSLKPDDLDIIAKSGFDWNVARPMIIARENGLTMDAMAKRQSDIQTARLAAATGAAQQGANNPLVANYNDFMNANSGKDAQAAADNAIKLTPKLAGIDRVTLADNIKALVKNAKDKDGKHIDVSYDQAAMALANAVHDNQWGFSTIKRGTHNLFDQSDDKISSFNGHHIDLGDAASKLTEIARPDTFSQANAYSKNVAALQNAPAADANFKAKYDHYTKMAAAYAVNPKKYAQDYSDAIRDLGVANTMTGIADRDAMSKNPLSVNPSTPASNDSKKANDILNASLPLPSNAPIGYNDLKPIRIF